MPAGVERALTRVPRQRFDVPPLSIRLLDQRHSDGNPFVTNDVTRQTLSDNADQPARYRPLGTGTDVELLSERWRFRGVPRCARATTRVTGGERIIARNPGGVFRQYLACVQRLDMTIEYATRGRQPGAPRLPAAEAMLTCT